MASGHIEGKRYPPQRWEITGSTPEHLRFALGMLGVREAVGTGKNKRPNPEIQKMYKKVLGLDDYDTIGNPWCAIGLDYWLEMTGTPSPKKPNARSFLSWGVNVPRDEAQEGDIVVFWRGKYDDKVTGHVAILLEDQGDTMLVLGANQSDMVCIRQFDADKVIGIRRARHWTSSRTIRAGAGAIASETGSKLVAQLPDVPSPVAVNPEQAMDLLEQVKAPLRFLSTHKPWIEAALAALTIGLVCYGLWCRYDDHRSGRNT